MIERLFNDQKVEDSKKQTHNHLIQILKLHKNISVERVTYPVSSHKSCTDRRTARNPRVAKEHRAIQVLNG